MATIRKQTLKSGKIVYDIQVKATDKGRALQVVRTLRWNPEKGMSEKKQNAKSSLWLINLKKKS